MTKIQLTDNSPIQESEYYPSNAVFNQMTEKEQSRMIGLKMMTEAVGGCGVKTLTDCITYASEMEYKYSDKKPKYIIGIDTYDPTKESKPVITRNSHYAVDYKEFKQPKTWLERWFGKYQWYKRWMYRKLIKRIAKYYNLNKTQIFP